MTKVISFSKHKKNNKNIMFRVMPYDEKIDFTFSYYFDEKFKLIDKVYHYTKD